MKRLGLGILVLVAVRLEETAQTNLKNALLALAC